jgi:RNA polymerase sigma-70 factor (ECF subfamily)
MPESDAERSDRDAQWVQRVRHGDSPAFEGLFLAYYERLVRFVYGYVKTRSAAEEVVQDVFFNIWSHHERWEVQGAVRTYLYAAARNRALNRLRRSDLEQRWAESVADDEDVVAVVPRVPQANERVELVELDAAIRHAIDQLPPRCRETFVLSRQHHLSYEQIAQVMEISVKTVQEQIARALRSLRTSLAIWLE